MMLLRSPLRAAALALALAAGLAAAAPSAKTVAMSTCVWRNDLVCDASPALIISKLGTSGVNVTGNPLIADALRVAAMEAACHVYDSADGCGAAEGCRWAPHQAPSCVVEPGILAGADVFKSGCPGSLMEAYTRCGAATSKAACVEAGAKCAWSDELDGASGGGGSAATRRRLSQFPGEAVPSSVPRACMPKALYALEQRGDREGVRRALRQLWTQDRAAWGDCPGARALRGMIKSCSGFSSSGTCKSIGAMCRWNEDARGCLITGAGQTTWVLGANASEIAEDAKRCSLAANKETCMTIGTVEVDPRKFVAVQTGDFKAATSGSAGRGAGAAAAVTAAAAGAVAALLLV